jgi:hypothetical protein
VQTSSLQDIWSEGTLTPNILEYTRISAKSGVHEVNLWRALSLTLLRNQKKKIKKKLVKKVKNYYEKKGAKLVDNLWDPHSNTTTCSATVSRGRPWC